MTQACFCLASFITYQACARPVEPDRKPCYDQGIERKGSVRSNLLCNCYIYKTNGPHVRLLNPPPRFHSKSCQLFRTAIFAHDPNSLENNTYCFIGLDYSINTHTNPLLQYYQRIHSENSAEMSLRRLLGNVNITSLFSTSLCPQHDISCDTVAMPEQCLSEQTKD